jgi:hypothetical protein
MSRGGHSENPHRVSASWIRKAMLADDAMREFLLAFQIRRDGELRGILEVA